MPARFDMPIDSLQGYAGTNPRPADFDDYWSAALAELDSLPENATFIRADFETPIGQCFHLHFDGIGAARIHARVILPNTGALPVPAVIRFHGYSGHAGEWSDLLPYAAMGWAVAALDCRGQAGRSEDPGVRSGTTWRGHIIRGLSEGPESLYYRAVFLDTVRLTRIIMAHAAVDESKVSATGFSQGGGLAVACAALEPRIAKLAAQCPFLSDFKRVWQLDLLKDAYEELGYFFRRFDPLHANAELFWTRLGYIDIQHLAPRIRGDSLFVVGLMDTVCPPSTQFAAYNKLGGTKSMLVYPDFQHEPYNGASDRILQFLSWDH